MRGFVSINSIPPRRLLRANLRLTRFLWRHDRPLVTALMRDPDAIFATADRRRLLLFGEQWTPEVDAWCAAQLCHESPRVGRDFPAMVLGRGWAAGKRLRTEHIGMIAGDRDVFIPLDLVRVAHAAISARGQHAELMVIPGAPHDSILVPSFATETAFAIRTLYRQWGIPLPPQTTRASSGG